MSNALKSRLAKLERGRSINEEGRLIIIHFAPPKGEEEPPIMGYKFKGVDYFGDDALARIEQDNGKGIGIVQCIYLSDLTDEELDLRIAEMSELG